LQTEEKAKYYSQKNILWLISLFVFTYAVLCAFVIIFPYEIRDADSEVYSKIGQQLAYISLPLHQILAGLMKHLFTREAGLDNGGMLSPVYGT